MNWRRGLLLAGINLVVATLLVVSVERRDSAYVRDYYVPSHTLAGIPETGPGLWSNEEGVSFNPCALLIHYSAQQEIAISANMPAVFLTGWRSPCPMRWQLSGIFHADTFAAPTPASMAAQRKVDVGLLIAIVLQWILVGGFPLSDPRRPWREPGAIITGCAVLAVALVFLPLMAEVARVPALFAVFAWFWWCGLLVWKLSRSVWRRMARGAVQPGQPI